MSSVQERIKRLNELNSQAAAPQHSQHVNVHNRGQSLSKPNAASTTLTKDKSHLFKTAKLIQKSFSTDSADGDAPFLSSPNKQQRRTQQQEEIKHVPSNGPNPILASLSDEEDDGEIDAAAAMSYWRNRGKRNNNDNRKEVKEISAPTKLTSAANKVNRTPAPVTKPASNVRLPNNPDVQLKKESVVVPLSPPRLQHMQPPKSTFNQDVVFDSGNIQQPVKTEEGEAPFDVTAANAASPRSTNHHYSMSPRAAPTLISVKSSETVLSGATSVLSDTSGVSTLSLRAKKFLKEKRKNGPILTGRSRGNTNYLGAETNMSTAKSILEEKAAKDRLKKKLAETKATKLQHIAVGEMNVAGEHFNMRPISAVEKKDELGADSITQGANITQGKDITQSKFITKEEDIAQIKADAPFDEPSKNDDLQNFEFESLDQAEKNGSNNKFPQRSKPKRSSLSDVIRVTQEDKSAYNDNDGSLSEFTNQSEINSVTNTGSVISTDASQLSSKASMASYRGRKTNAGQRVNDQPEPTAPKAEEEDIIEVLGSYAAEAGCQVFEAFESLANVILGNDEVAKKPNVPFDEDVAIEVEYVEQK